MFAEALRDPAALGWLFLPSAVILGALHGLEPGHSKTMMAAFIVAVRGTVAQAVVLALSATASHTAVVWLVAGVAMTLGKNWLTPANEPYFQLASAAIIVAMAAWMLWRIRQTQQAVHHHDHDHDHHHEGEDGPMDAHALAHARDIETRFAGRSVSMGQVVVFGLTGGLMPCSAAVTVLLVCLQIQRFWLGMALVTAFSVGLALTLLGFGVAAAWAMHHVRRRWPAVEGLARKAPYLSAGLLMLIGLAIAAEAVGALRHP